MHSKNQTPIKSQKTVLCIFPRFYTGGVSKALSFVANKCDEAGMDVHCVALRKEPETIVLNPSICRYVYDVIGKPGIYRLFRYSVFIFNIRKLLRRIRPDVIIVFRADLVRMCVYATLGMNIPIIGSERGNPLLYGELLNKYRRAFRRASAIVYQTMAARDVYGIKTKSVIIPNPAVTRKNSVFSKKRKNGKNIVTASRLSKEKNVEGLLRAFAMAKNELSDRKLFVYGDGEDLVYLEHLAYELGIGNSVIFTGNVNDFTAEDDDASIFVLNSLSEGMPNALIEAMMSGYACICTDSPIGAPRWLSDHGRRIRLVPIQDDTALSAALVEIATDSVKLHSLAENANEVKDLLNPERVGDQWLNLVNEVIDEHQKKS